jgi:hypothetical protein
VAKKDNHFELLATVAGVEPKDLEAVQERIGVASE